MASIKSRKMRSGKRMLYVKYEANGKEVVKATGQEDTPANRKYLKEKVLPALEKRLEAKEFVKPKKEVKNRLKEFSEVYLREKEHLKTYSEIQKRVESIVKIFGQKDISKIEISELRDWVFNFEASPKTLKNYITDFRGIFDIAVYDGVIDSNPFDGKIRIPKHTKRDISPYSDEEIAKVLHYSTGQLHNFFGIAFNTGMRAGEIIALTVHDIDFESMTINVNKNITKGVITTPKTATSVRTVPLFQGAVPYIEAQIEAAKSKRSLYLFSKDDGSPLRDISSLNALRFLKQIGVHHRVHDTRHTFIVKMLNSGKIKVMDLARMVGHSSPQMILTTYAKYVKGEQLTIDRDIDLTCDPCTQGTHPNFSGYTRKF